MADNVTINDADAVEQTVATDEVGGAHYQVVKVGFGSGGAAIMASSDNPLPVTLSGGGGSSGTQYNEDAVHASGDTGNLMLAVRRDTAAVGSGADGDYSTLNVDANGRLHVVFGNSTIAVTNAGTFATQINGDALTALQLIDDTVATDGSAAVTKLFQVGGTDGTNAQILSVDSSGRAYVNVNGTVTVTGAGGTFPVTDSGGSLTIDAPVGTPAFVRLSDGTDPLTTLPVSLASVPSHAVTNAGTFAVQVSSALPAGTNAIGKLAANDGVDIGNVDVASIAAGDNNIGNVDIVTVPSDPFGANADSASATGSISAKLRFIASTGIPITGTVTVGSHAVTNAGTFVVQVDGNALTSLQLLDDTVFVDDAAFTPATSKVLATGFIVDETTPDSLDEGDIGAARITADRSQYVCTIPISGYVYENGIRLEVKRAIIDCASSGNNTILAAVTNKKIRVLSLFLVSAGTVNVRFESGADGTALSGQMNLVANTGFVLPHNPDGWFQAGESTLLNLELSGAVSVDGAFTYVEAE